MSKAFLWNNLLEYIDEQLVIPILGPELLLSRVDGRDVMLHRYVAERLAEEFRVASNDLPEDDTLNFVVCRVLDDNNDPEAIYPVINRILKGSRLTIPDPLLKLARIRHFKLFITTTFDSLLEQALTQERPEDLSPTQVLTYSPNDPQDLEREWQKRQGATVYHLLGKVSASPDYVITEEDTLEYFHGMQKARPGILFDTLKEKHLLIIGSSFPDWLARFFIRIAKGDRLPSSERRMFEFVVDRRVHGQREDKNLVLFLDHFSRNTRIFEEGSAIDFVNELSDRYEKLYPPGKVAVPLPAVASEAGVQSRAPLLFLSYASQDLTAAKTIRDALVQLGWDVWFDKHKLEGGDHYGQKIEEGINNCALFLPVISAATQERRKGYFREEWLLAAEQLRQVSDRATWAIPIAIDETPEKGADIPEIFEKLKLQWLRLPSGTPTPEFTKKFKDLLREEIKRQKGIK